MNDSCVPSSLAKGPLFADTDEDLEGSMAEFCHALIAELKARNSASHPLSNRRPCDLASPLLLGPTPENHATQPLLKRVLEGPGYSS